MNILYFRSSVQRQRKFQIKTKIVEINGEKKVIKEPIYPEGEQHLYTTYKNIELAKELYGEQATPGEYIDGMLITPYYSGKSMGSEIRRCIQDNEKGKEINNLLALWKQLIIGTDNNCCQFEMSRKFMEIFGDANELIGDDATVISNLDCSSENILFLEDGTIKIFDYECFFSFPIPIDFLFYRMLWLYKENNQNLIDWNMLLTMSGISTSKVKIYDRLLNNFNDYIGIDKERNIYYGALGKQFLSPKINSNSLKYVSSYKFSTAAIPERSKLLIYGAGKVGVDYYNFINKSCLYEVVAWADKKAALFCKQGMNIIKCEDIEKFEYDYILIAVLRENVAEEIKSELLELGINEKKIIWLQPEKI